MKFFKISKLHLTSKECQEMFLDNVKFSKKTQQFYPTSTKNSVL
ncbi:hypothetical protein BD0084_15790 [Helicobacter pylori]